MKPMNENEIETKADEISSWLQDAVWDMTDSIGDYSQLEKECKTNDNYNNVSILKNLCGDRIHDAATELSGTWKNPEFNLYFVAIAEKMKENAHTALKKALNKLIERHKS